jgi:ABC-type multidrug transport system fused ATPase/permease subunit
MAQGENMGDKNRLGTFRKLLAFLKPHRVKVGLGISALVTVTLLELIPPAGMRYIVDSLLIPSSHPRLGSTMTSIVHSLGADRNVTSARVTALLIIVFGLALLYLAIALLNKARAMIMHILGEKFILDLRRTMYSHLQKLSLTFFETRQTGEIMSRVTNDSEVVEEFVTHAADTVVADALNVIAIAFIMVRLCPSLALVTLIPVPILALITYKYSRKVRKIHRATRERLAEMNAKLQDNLSGIRVIKSFAREDHEYNRFAREAEEVYDMRVNVVRRWTTFFQTTTITVRFGTLIVWG